MELYGVSRAYIAEVLWRYGEEDLAVRMLDSSTEVFGSVLDRALEGQLERDQTSTVDRMIAVGTVEVLTGQARLPKRKRSRRRDSAGDFWEGIGRQRASQPTALQDWREVHGPPPTPVPYLGPFVRYRGYDSRGPNREQLLWILRYLDSRNPYLLVGRNASEAETYIQAHRLGRGRVLIEHRAGGVQTHQHLTVRTTVEAADILSAWLTDEPAWPHQLPWEPGMPDIVALRP